jgi:zinc transporter 1/2/3
VEQVVEATMDGANAVMPYGIPLNGWKVIFQAFLTTLNVLCWLIPLRSKKISENKLALSLANAFSGGVFLSLAFGHLIPECVHGFEGYNEVTPYLLVLSGYLLIFFVEKVAFDTHEILHEMENADEKKLANGEATQGATSGRSAIVLLGALAVHSILEMAALGLADTFGDSAILTLSIALHQVRIFVIICQNSAQILTYCFRPRSKACRIDCTIGRIFEIRIVKG